MLTEQTVLSIFANELNGWSRKDLELAVKQNTSLAQQIRLYRSTELHMWRGLASSYRLMNRRDYDRTINAINYHSVLSKVRQVNPALASAVESTRGADVWLVSQIKDVKHLIIS